MPKISIIMPTFNVEKYIARAIKSCINQTFKDIEIIIVDDLGSDNSINIAKEYAKKDERIKIIHNEKNLGTFAARNAGIKAAGGGYLLFLDPDDYLELDICKIALENICDCNLLSFSYVKIDNNNYEIFSAKWKDYNSYLKLIKKKKFTPWNLCNLIVKKDFYIQKINSFSSERLLLAEDMLVFSFLVDCKMKAIEYVGYYYVINSNSITCLNKIEDNLKQYEKILELINNSNIEQKIKKYYSYFLNNSILDCKYKLNLINIIHYKLVKFVFYLQKKLRF